MDEEIRIEMEVRFLKQESIIARGIAPVPLPTKDSVIRASTLALFQAFKDRDERSKQRKREAVEYRSTHGKSRRFHKKNGHTIARFATVLMSLLFAGCSSTRKESIPLPPLPPPLQKSISRAAIERQAVIAPQSKSFVDVRLRAAKGVSQLSSSTDLISWEPVMLISMSRQRNLTIREYDIQNPNRFYRLTRP